MKTFRIPELFVKIIFEFIKFEYQMAEIRLVRNQNYDIDEPFDSPNYRRVRMLGNIKDYLERLLTNKKERRNEDQEVFTWYNKRSS